MKIEINIIYLKWKRQSTYADFCELEQNYILLLSALMDVTTATVNLWINKFNWPGKIN